MAGRSYGRGKIRRAKAADGTWRYVGDWVDATGRRHRRTLATDRRVAERKMADIIRGRDLAERGMQREEGQDMLLSDLRDRYLEELDRRRRPAYVARMRAALERALGSIHAARVRDATKERLLAYRGGRLRDGVSNRTANIETGALRAMLRWAEETDIIGASPLQGFRRLPEDESTERKRRRALTDEEIARFLAAAAAEDARRAAHASADRTIEGGTKGPGYAAKKRRPLVPQLPLWEVLLSRGLRWGEAAGATWGDLDAGAATLTVQATIAKGRRRRVVPLPRNLVDALTDLRGRHGRVTGRLAGPRDLIFLSRQGAPLESHNARRGLRRILAAAEIPVEDDQGRSVDIHALRTSAITRMLRHGVPVEVVARIVGHADVRITMRHYADLRIEDAEAALRRLPDLPTAGAEAASASAAQAEK